MEGGEQMEETRIFKVHPCGSVKLYGKTTYRIQRISPYFTHLNHNIGLVGTLKSESNSFPSARTIEMYNTKCQIHFSYLPIGTKPFSVFAKINRYIQSLLSNNTR